MRTVAVALAALVAVASASMSTISTYGGCKWTWHDPTLLGSQQASATYDVSALTVPESSAYAYRAHDPHNEQENQDRYEYTYNVCGDVPSSAVPDPNNCPAGRTAAYRTMLAPTDDDAITDDAQLMEEGEAGVGISDACKPLTPAIGGRYAKQSVAYAALHDSDRPAHGFTIAYPAYSATLKCKTPPSDPNKTANYLQFRHVFICEDFATPTAQQTNGEYNRTLVLSEDDAQGCFIDVYMFGHAGCPQECPIVNGKVCGGNGICDYDENIHKARCFCNDDFIESDCQTPLDPSPTGGIVGAVFGGLIIGAAIVGAFWYFRMRNAGPGSAAGSAPADGYYEAAEG